MKENKIANILIFFIMIAIAVILILLSKGDFKIGIPNKKSTEMEYEKLKEYINNLNMKNINAYQDYQNELQKNYYINNKDKRPANNIDIKSFTISFVEEYNGKYIYKINSTSNIESFSFNYAPQLQQGKVLYGDLPGNLSVIMDKNTDYYFAKDKKSNEYIKIKLEYNREATATKDLELLKSNL